MPSFSHPSLFPPSARLLTSPSLLHLPVKVELLPFEDEERGTEAVRSIIKEALRGQAEVAFGSSGPNLVLSVFLARNKAKRVPIEPIKDKLSQTLPSGGTGALFVLWLLSDTERAGQVNVSAGRGEGVSTLPNPPRLTEGDATSECIHLVVFVTLQAEDKKELLSGGSPVQKVLQATCKRDTYQNVVVDAQQVADIREFFLQHAKTT